MKLELKKLVSTYAYAFSRGEKVLYCDYAEQSSFNEIRDFLSILRFRKLTPLQNSLTIPLKQKLKRLVFKDKEAGNFVHLSPCFEGCRAEMVAPSVNLTEG